MILKKKDGKPVSFRDLKLHLFVNICDKWRKKGVGWGCDARRDLAVLEASGVIMRSEFPDAKSRDPLARLWVPTEYGLAVFDSICSAVLGE